LYFIILLYFVLLYYVLTIFNHDMLIYSTWVLPRLCFYTPEILTVTSCLWRTRALAFRRLRSRRLESRYQTIRLRVRRNEIFMVPWWSTRTQQWWDSWRCGKDVGSPKEAWFGGVDTSCHSNVGKTIINHPFGNGLYHHLPTIYDLGDGLLLSYPH
jgi:hypothetical protein